MQLFQAELQYDPKHTTDLTSAGRVGSWLGGGEGTIKGEKIEGQVVWDLFEKQGKYNCETEMVLDLTTEQGEEIHIIAKGFGAVGDVKKPNDWQMGATLTFTTSSKKFDWLKRAVYTWNGSFDMSSGIHKYTAVKV
jgi:hypothetical protein